MSDRYDAAQIAKDLGECRQRGLDWLDRRTGNQRPVGAAALQQLAADYVATSGLVAAGRIDQIKLLLKFGIEQYAKQGHAAEANLIRDLFFGQSMDGAIRPPGELLKDARTRLGDTEARSRERRYRAMSSFALFLVGLARMLGDGPEESRDELPGSHQQLITTGYVDDNEHFIHMLATASRVTIIGLTNERLLPMLQDALSRKHASVGEGAFWDSLRIVFLSDDLLAGINDQREEINDPREALRQRRQEAYWAHRSIGTFLKLTSLSRWAIYKSPYTLALTGALFEFGQRRKIVRIMVRRARQPNSENLYIELEDHEEWFAGVFEDIVRHSVGNAAVPVGAPVGQAFQCTGLRLRSAVLHDNSKADGWLPMILVVMSRHQSGQEVPILQLRTIINSVRELNRLSHLSGHIYQQDYEQPAEPQPTTFWSFGPASEVPLRAAERLVADVAAIDASGSLVPVTTGRYLYPDKEHLFFFVFSLKLPEGTQFPRRAEMHAFSLSDLLAVRANQVLRSAAQLCVMPAATERSWAAAADLLALNLTLHDHAELGNKLIGLADQHPSERADMAAQITSLVTERTAPSLVTANSEVPLMGLAGWQYREFFSQMLPVYAEIGIPGAAAVLEQVQVDSAKKYAKDRLAQLYQDEDLLAVLPMEL